MTGTDAQKYEYTKEKALTNGLTVTTHGDAFKLTKDNSNFGHFATLAELFSFLCGYEAGKSDSL